MKTDPATSRVRAAFAAPAQRFAVPRLYVLIGLTFLAWVLAAGVIAALWSLVRFITA